MRIVYLNVLNVPSNPGKRPSIVEQGTCEQLAQSKVVDQAIEEQQDDGKKHAQPYRPSIEVFIIAHGSQLVNPGLQVPQRLIPLPGCS